MGELCIEQSARVLGLVYFWKDDSHAVSAAAVDIGERSRRESFLSPVFLSSFLSSCGFRVEALSLHYLHSLLFFFSIVVV